MLESALEQAVRKYVRSLGGRCFKWVCPGEAGAPDRICILPGGRIIFVELKRPGRKDGLSGRQKKMLRTLRALGCEAARIDSLDGLKDLLKGGGQNEL